MRIVVIVIVIFSILLLIAVSAFFLIFGEKRVVLVDAESSFEFTIQKNRVIQFPVIIDGISYNFMLDTGCSSSMLDKSVLDKLQKSRRRAGGRFNTNFYGIRSWKKAYYLEQDLQLGTLSIKNVRWLQTDLSEFADILKIDGIIGMDVMEQTGLSLDFEKCVGRLGIGNESFMNAGKSKRYSFYRKLRTPYFSFTIDGATHDFLFDTGFDGYMDASPKFWEELSRINQSRTSSFKDIKGEPFDYLYLDSIHFDGMRLTNQVVSRNESDPSLVGIRFISNGNWFFNFKDNVVYYDFPENVCSFLGNQYLALNLETEFFERKPVMRIDSLDTRSKYYELGMRENDLIVAMDDSRDYLTVEKRSVLLPLQFIDFEFKTLTINRAGQELVFDFSVEGGM